MAKLLYTHEEMIPSEEKWEEPSSEPTQADIEKDFDVFYLADTEESPEPSRRPCLTAQVNTSQEVTDIPEGMVLEEKMPKLLTLLTTHTGGNSLVVPVIPWPPTFVPPYPSSSKTAKKKRKKGKPSRKESSKKREIPPTTQ